MGFFVILNTEKNVPVNSKVFYHSELPSLYVFVIRQTQPTFNCSKLTIETPEHFVKIVKVTKNDTRTTSMTSF